MQPLLQMISTKAHRKLCLKRKCHTFIHTSSPLRWKAAVCHLHYDSDILDPGRTVTGGYWLGISFCLLFGSLLCLGGFPSPSPSSPWNACKKRSLAKCESDFQMSFLFYDVPSSANTRGQFHGILNDLCALSQFSLFEWCSHSHRCLIPMSLKEGAWLSFVSPWRGAPRERFPLEACNKWNGLGGGGKKDRTMCLSTCFSVCNFQSSRRTSVRHMTIGTKCFKSSQKRMA